MGKTDPRLLALERKVLANSLKQYAINGITGAIGKEYNEQLAEWEKHLNSLMAYASTALQEHKNLVEKAKEDQRREAELTMFVLSLLAGPALSFVSGYLQYRVGPNFFGKRTKSFDKAPTIQVVQKSPIKDPVRPIPKPDPATVSIPMPPDKPTYAVRQIVKEPKQVPLPKAPPMPAPKPPVADIKVPAKISPLVPNGYDTDWSKTMGKVFGDMGGKLVGQMGTKVSANIADLDNALLAAVFAIPDSASLEMFKMNIRNVWISAKTRGESGLQGYSELINNTATWGDDLLDGKIPGVTPYGDATATDRAAEEHYYGEIRKMLDAQRQQWAKEWFFYGNNPLPVSQKYAVNALETEMWALWFRAEEFKHYMRQSYMLNYGGQPVFDKVVGNSGLKIDRFAKRLRDLGVIEGSWETEYLRRPKDIANEMGLQAIEIDDIYGDVDTREEVESINKWAWSHQPKLLTGQFGASTRSVAPLRADQVKKPV